MVLEKIKMTFKRKFISLIIVLFVTSLFFTSCGKEKEKIKVLEISSNSYSNNV